MHPSAIREAQMDHPQNEPSTDKTEELENAESAVSLEELDIPADLKSELLRELEGLKEGDDARRRGA